MEEQQALSPPQTTSFMTRAANVFMSPGELYTEVATAKVQSSSWVIPMILTIIMALLFTYTMFTNPTFKEQFLEGQRQALQQKVDKGEMTQAERERAEQFMESSNIMLYTGLAGSAIVPPVIMVCAALGLWLVGKLAFGAAAPYLKWLEAFGLASLIGVAGGIISLITMHLFGSLYATVSGGLFVMHDYDSTRFLHRLLVSISVFGIWQTAAVGMAMAKIAAKPAGTALAVVFALWLLVTLGTAASGIGVG